MKKLALLPIALMLLILTQCTKKNNVAVSSFIEDVHITFTSENINDRTLFHHNNGSFTWSGMEYIYVGASGIGYLGKIDNGGSGSTFSGEIDMPSVACTLYFIYLGNGSKSVTAGATTTTMNFSDQSAAGTESTVTNYHIASAPVTYNPGDVSFTATLETKIAIAHVDLSGFGSDVVYMNGGCIYDVAEINFTNGDVTGTNGDVILGAGGSDKYVALIPQKTASETTVHFNSVSKSGDIVFLRGIQKNKYYCIDASTPLNIETTSLPTTPLTKVFTVSPTKRVKFAPGNLRYHQSNNQWSFAAHQYDYIGSWDANGYQDLFNWGQNGENETYMNNYTKYYTHSADLSMNNKADWGYVVKIGGMSWRTLSEGEWDTLFNKRAIDVRYAKACVNGVNGVIILPDDWSSSYYTFIEADDRYADYAQNEISKEIWDNNIEAHGAVFLPAAGFRQGKVVRSEYVGVFGRYWSTTHQEGKSKAHMYIFTRKGMDFATYDYRNVGAAVRLVCDVAAE